MIFRSTGVVAVFVVAAAVVSAAQTVTKPGEMKKATVTIQQIDSTLRIITYRTEDGKEDTVYAGQDVQRFNELKVGDKVNVTYYESSVYKIRKPGDAPLSVGTSGTEVTRGTGALPSATAAKQTVNTVTVKAVDQAAGTISVTTPLGRDITRKVDDKANLAGVKAGDQIDIVVTEAMLVSVERAN